VDLEILMEHFDQRWIELRLILVQSHRKTRTYTAAIQGNWYQYERSPVFPLIFTLLCPDQKPWLAVRV